MTPTRRVVDGLAAIAFASLALCAEGAESQAPGFAYPPPDAGAIKLTSKLRYGTADTTTLAMDLYQPRLTGSAKTPALIFFNLAYGTQRETFEIYSRWASHVASRGVTAIVPDLRPSAFRQDFERLVSHLMSHGESYGIDTSAIAVYAGSGNVAAALPIVEDPRQTAIKAAVVYYGTADVTTFRRDLPLLLVRAGLDRPGLNGGTGEGITALAASAIAQNAPISVINHPTGRHGFEVGDDAGTRLIIDRTVDFVKTASSRVYQAALRNGLDETTAAALVVSRNFGPASEIYARLVGRRPNDPSLRLAYGESLLGDRQFRAACDEFAKLRGKGLGARDLGLPAARACLQAGDGEAALQWLRSIPARYLPRAVAGEPVFTPLKDRAEFRALFERPPG
jgi:hypothetical protein